MRNDDSVSASLRDDAFTRIVRGVYVHIRHRAQQLFAPRQARVPERRTREPLDGTMHAEVNDRVRLELVLKPFVGGPKIQNINLVAVFGAGTLTRGTHFQSLYFEIACVCLPGAGAPTGGIHLRSPDFLFP